MIGIGLGLLLIAGALAMLAGVGGRLPGMPAFDPLLLLGYGGAAAVLALGALLLADGVVRRAIRRSGGTSRALRTMRLTAAALMGVTGLAIGLPLAAGPANLVHIEEMPLGYYLAAQGALVGLVILAFVWAARQNDIEAGEPDA